MPSTFLASSVSSNLLLFNVNLISGNKKKSGGDKSGEYGGDVILESLVLPRTAVLMLQCEVSRRHIRAVDFLFPKTEFLLDEFFEPNETILPHSIPYSHSKPMEQIPCE
jgi:hypothetical protein